MRAGRARSLAAALARAAGAVGIAATLAACSSTGHRASAPERQARPGDAPAAAGARRPGAYYRDDGPGDRPPADAASVPDPVPRPEPLLERANRPYTVFDRQYVPMVRLEPFRQRGTGSWYGRRYHGQRTSSGEVYDMYAMTAAHPTLPIPSYARVTNVANGSSAIVRVNDRGPFLYDRIIDLSYSAAARLGYLAAGSAEVEVELITRFDGAAPSAPAPAAPTASRARAAPGDAVVRVADAGDAAAPALERLELQTTVAGTPAPGAVWLQLGAFGSRENAEALRTRLARQLDWPVERIEIRADGRTFRLQAGPYARRDDALADAERIGAATGSRPFPVGR